MKRRLSVWLGVFALLCVTLVGCGELGATFGDLIGLQQALTAEYGGSSFEMTIVNGNVLEISMGNDEIFALEEEAFDAKAEEIALFIADNYGGIDKLDRIELSVEVQSNVGIVNVSRYRSVTFRVSDLVAELGSGAG